MQEEATHKKDKKEIKEAKIKVFQRVILVCTFIRLFKSVNLCFVVNNSKVAKFLFPRAIKSCSRKRVNFLSFSFFLFFSKVVTVFFM